MWKTGRKIPLKTCNWDYRKGCFYKVLTSGGWILIHQRGDFVVVIIILCHNKIYFVPSMYGSFLVDQMLKDHLSQFEFHLVT